MSIAYDLKLEEARTLIRAHRYDEARQLLRRLRPSQHRNAMLSHVQQRSAQSAQTQTKPTPTTTKAANTGWRIAGQAVPQIPFILVCAILGGFFFYWTLLLIHDGFNPIISVLIGTLSYTLFMSTLILIWRYFWWLLMFVLLLIVLWMLWLIAYDALWREPLHDVAQGVMIVVF